MSVYKVLTTQGKTVVVHNVETVETEYSAVGRTQIAVTLKFYCAGSRLVRFPLVNVVSYEQTQ